MDAEPGRCRRTDGRKWRCRFAVLPDQKYCERHVNRGRNRSRKPVEVNNQTLLKTSVSSMKASAPNLESAVRKHNKVGIKNQSHTIKKNSTENAHTPLEFTVSLESAFQHDNVRACGTSNSNNSIVAAAVNVAEVQLPDQKYCMDYMDRGVKRVEDNSQKSNASLSFSVGASY